MVRNGIFNLIGQILKLASGVLIMPLLVKFLGLSLFGLLSWSTAILAAVQLAEGGLSSGLLYFLSEITLYENSNDSIKRRNEILTSGMVLLLISTFLVIVILFFASPILVSSLKNINSVQVKELETTLILGAFLVGLRIIQSFFWAILQSQQMYKVYSVFSTAQIVVTNSSWVLIAFYGEKNLSTYITISIAISLFFTVYLSTYVFKLFPWFKFQFSKTTTFIMLKYNAGILGSNLGSILFSQGDKLVIANTLGINLLSVYTIFTSVVAQLNQFAAQAVHPIIPLISSVSQHSLSKFESISVSIKKLFLLNIYISLGGAGIFIILAESILKFFLRENFLVEYIFPFQLLSLIYGIYTISVTGYYITLSLGKSNKVMSISVFCGVTTLISIYLSSELIGAVLSNAFFFFILILLFDGMKKVGIELKSWFKLVYLPLIVVIVLSILLSILTPNFLAQLFLSFIFTTFMVVSFVIQYEAVFEKKMESITALFKTISKL